MDHIDKITEELGNDDCQHKEFAAEVNVNRLSVEEGGAVDSFQADISIVCAQCGIPFHFVGVDQGLSFCRPMAAFQALELRCPIKPGPGPINFKQIFEVPYTAIESAGEEGGGEEPPPTIPSGM